MKKKNIINRERVTLKGERILEKNSKTIEQGIGLATQKVLHYKLYEKSVIDITYYDDSTKKISIKAPDKNTEKILYEYFS
jgi:hypothetical protein